MLVVPAGSIFFFFFQLDKKNNICTYIYNVDHLYLSKYNLKVLGLMAICWNIGSHMVTEVEQCRDWTVPKMGNYFRIPGTVSLGEWVV